MKANYHTYKFAVTACDKGAYIIADMSGGTFYLPKEILSRIPGYKLHMGDLLEVVSSEKLEFTELSATNSIICHGTVRARVTGSLLNSGKTASFLVSDTSYGSTLLTETRTGKDYLIFTSYITEGYRTPGIHWKSVTEGNIISFLLFGDMPVMPAPRKKSPYAMFRRMAAVSLH